MGKKKKSLGIKTARYFTNVCSNCKTEYPNWFTSCPNCGASWDEMEAEVSKKQDDSYNKNIKIVVKITKEDFSHEILHVKLFFSADQGQSWYQMNMTDQIEHYMAEIHKVPSTSIIIYYIEVFLANGEKIVENNDGKYFYYRVGVVKEEIKEEPPESYSQNIKKNVDLVQKEPESYDNVPIEQLTDEQKKTLLQKNLTIFGKPQTLIDPNFKPCPHCKAKIEQSWTKCPICGKET